MGILRCLGASPMVLSLWLQTVKFTATKSKCAGLAQEIGFSAPNSWSLRCLVKGATQLCNFKKECNKLDLTAAQYFWFVQWFAIGSPRSFSFIGGVAKKQKVKLGHLILLSSVTLHIYLARLEMLSFSYFFFLLLQKCWSVTRGFSQIWLQDK